MKTLKHSDYKKILKYYSIRHKRMTRKQMKNKAEDIIAKKLCSCIKKVDPLNERKSIAICVNSILKKRNLKVHRFSCRKKPKLLRKNKTKKKIFKYKTIKF